MQNLNLKKVWLKKGKVLEEMGVKFFLGKEIEADINFKDIYKDYDAVFLGMGTYTSLEGGFRGEKLLNVHKAINYLVESNKKLLGINQKRFLYRFKRKGCCYSWWRRYCYGL